MNRFNQKFLIYLLNIIIILINFSRDIFGLTI